MNVILLENIGRLGELGDEVKVKAGFARNFLIPQGKAVRATTENRSVFETRRAELEKLALEKLEGAQGRAARLEGVALTIIAMAGEEGKLYGSVGTQDIADAISAKGEAVTKAEVRLPEGVIRSIGEYTVDVQLHGELSVSIPVEVVAE